MDSKTATFEKRIDKKLERASDRTVKKATKKMKKETPELTRPGCKDQFNHNSAVLEHLEAAANHIREAEVKEALEEIEEGKTKIVDRQKHVLLADREEHGWNFVKSYKRDELAQDSANEKHMARARASSSRKSSQTQRSRGYKTVEENIPIT